MNEFDNSSDKIIDPEIINKLNKILNNTAEKIISDTPTWELNELTVKNRLRESVKTEIELLPIKEHELKLVFEENEKLIENKWNEIKLKVSQNLQSAGKPQPSTPPTPPQTPTVPDYHGTDQYKEIPPYSDIDPYAYRKPEQPRQQYPPAPDDYPPIPGQYPEGRYYPRDYGRPQSKTFGTVAIVLGVLGICCAGIIGFFFAVPAIILGAVGRTRDTTPNAANTGIVLGVMAIVCSIIYIFFIVPIIDQILYGYL